MSTPDAQPRRVHFPDTYHPSSLSLRLTLGPKDNPTMVVRISVYFEYGRMPRIKIRTKKPSEKSKKRRRSKERERERGRSYGDDVGAGWRP
jgi:hypothetical protein